MALRDKLTARAQPYLEPGEQVQQVFCAYSGPSPYFAFLSSLIILFAGHYHIIVVSDRAVVVLDAGKFRSTFPKRLRIRGPRQVVMGDPVWPVGRDPAGSEVLRAQAVPQGRARRRGRRRLSLPPAGQPVLCPGRLMVATVTVRAVR